MKQLSVDTAALSATRKLPLEAAPGREFQFKLRRIQTYRWGTFDDLQDIEISEKGHLILGPSGSGKSTLLDGHASLIVPQSAQKFNNAARGTSRANADRNWASYVRGAYANRTDEDTNEKVKKFLREGTTWSAICETYRDGTSRVLTIGQILWIKGASTANNDVRPLYFTCEREFSLRELQVLPDSDFDVRKLKAQLSDAWFVDTFPAYETRLMRLFGISSNRALRLLHKTQSAKDLDDLNKFLRESMLDDPETFEAADKMVADFKVLDGAHQAVLEARQQIAALKPAREALIEHEQFRQELLVLAEQQTFFDYFLAQWKRDLWQTHVTDLQTQLQAVADGLDDKKRREAAEKLGYERAHARTLGAGGDLLATLEGQLNTLVNERLPAAQRAEGRLLEAIGKLGWRRPNSTENFAHVQQQADEALANMSAEEDAADAVLEDAKDKRKAANARLGDVLQEVRALESRNSNMPSHLLNIRERMCKDLDLEEQELPFAGELLQVRSEDAQWTGAIERVLSGFAKSMLVEQRLYSKVAAWVNRNHLGGKLTYDRMEPRAASDGERLAADSLVRKLDVAPDHRVWLTDELRAKFDYHCVQTAEELTKTDRGVTLAGQVKRNRTQHEKDDRNSIDNPRFWLLGFSNKDKKAALASDVASLTEQIRVLEEEVTTADRKVKGVRERAKLCQAVAEAVWVECNVTGVLEEQKRLSAQIEREKQQRPELKTLQDLANSAKTLWDNAVRVRQGAEGEFTSVTTELAKAQRKLDEIPKDLLSVRVSPDQDRFLEERFLRVGRKVTVDSIDSVAREAQKGLGETQRVTTEKQKDAEQRLVVCLQKFCNQWPVAAEGLDASLASSGEFMAKLQRLEGDGIDQYVERFAKLLRDQSFQNLAVLNTLMDNERSAIKDRLDQVNQSLARSPFDENTYLELDYGDRFLPQVAEFRQQVKSVLAHSFKDDNIEEMERRFAEFNAVVKRLSGAEAEDRKWKDLVLDVRQHVQFTAIERDSEGREVERHDGGSGKSGGQRQKLATTCLAAALRYQLAGEEGDWPSYCTVVMDEAFDHTDTDFTKMVLNIFKRLGFQVIAATPVKNVMAMEAFIGGGTFVSIHNRRRSEVLPITYDLQEQRLDLPREAQELAAEEHELEAEESSGA